MFSNVCAESYICVSAMKEIVTFFLIFFFFLGGGGGGGEGIYLLL